MGLPVDAPGAAVGADDGAPTPAEGDAPDPAPAAKGANACHVGDADGVTVVSLAPPLTTRAAVLCFFAVVALLL
eukprot:4880064-Prymnesium_polylepis.1